MMQPGLAIPHQYKKQLAEKLAMTSAEFKPLAPPEIEVFPSPDSHFRMRAEFKIWHSARKVVYAMYEPGKYKQAIVIENFSIGSTTIGRLMPILIESLNADTELKLKLFQVEFLSTSTGDALISLIYHRKLNEQWIAKAKALEAELGCSIIGRSRGQKVILSKDYVVEEFSIHNKKYIYRQVESSFTQPNAQVCHLMLSWAHAISINLGGDLLELYCGNGNFTLPLSANFEKVLATEVSKTSVNSALVNIEQNGIDNVALVRMSSEEFTQAMNGDRPFRRLRNIDLQCYDFSTVFVDPPRAGLDDATVQLVRNFDNILYISCNPETLKRNLENLYSSHKLTRFALFDQFPYTHHRELGVLLQRR